MNAREAPITYAAMIMPSMSMCGHFCMSSRSLNVPGSDSSALQTRYLSIAPFGRNEAFLPIAKPAPPRPRMPERVELAEDGLALHGERLAQRAVAAPPLVDLEGVEVRLVDVLEEEEVGHERLAFGSTLLRRMSCFSGSTSSPSRICSTTVGDLADLDRADVGAVDRHHRRDVARAEALELAQVDARVVADLVEERLVELVGAAQRARDVRADVDVVLADRVGEQHVVERRDRRQVAGRQAHHARGLLDALRRAPAVVVLDLVERGDGGRAAVGVLRHVRLDARAQRLGHRRRRGIGNARGVLLEVGRLVPAGDPGAVPEARHPCRIDRH